MNKIKLGTMFVVTATLFATLVVQAQSQKKLQPKKVKQKAASVQSKNEVEPVRIPQRSPLAGSRQGYKMVTDVLDGFGGESESDNYRIPVNSGGQPSAIGLSESDNYVVQAGYIYASHVKRGDVNGDGIIELGDIVYLINYAFRGGNPPCPMEAGDANCDGIVDLGDIVFLINYLYRGGAPPAC